MTEDQYIEDIHSVIQLAVQRAGGNWRQSFKEETMQIMLRIGDAYTEGWAFYSERLGKELRRLSRIEVRFTSLSVRHLAERSTA